jgi:hypothetical protein
MYDDDDDDVVFAFYETQLNLTSLTCPYIKVFNVGLVSTPKFPDSSPTLTRLIPSKDFIFIVAV